MASADKDHIIDVSNDERVNDGIDLIKKIQTSLEKNKNDDSILQELPREELVKLIKRLNPAGTLNLTSTAGQARYTLLGITHMARSLMINEIMLSAIGYLYQSLEEYKDKYVVDDDTLDNEEFKYIREFKASFKEGGDEEPREPSPAEIKQHLDEYRAKLAKADYPIVQKFLNTYFKFDPNRHVARIGEFDINKVEIPAEPFFAFDHYVSVHHEEITRIVTEKIFKHPAYIRDVLYVAASGLNEAEAKTKFAALKDTTKVPLFLVEEGQVVLIGDAKRIRENMDLGGGDILSRVLNKQADDRKLAEEMLKKTVKIAKIQNMRRVGLDDPEFLEHIRGLYPDREPNELFTKEELEQHRLKYEAYKMRKQNEMIAEAAPVGTKVIPMIEINPREGTMEQKVAYSEIDHYLETPA